MEEIMKEIFQYGGTVIMAGLFVYVFLQDRSKNNKLLEGNNKLLESISESNNNLAKSNENIAKALNIIKSNQVQVENKVDRNYQAIIERRD